MLLNTLVSNTLFRSAEIPILRFFTEKKQNVINENIITAVFSK